MSNKSFDTAQDAPLISLVMIVKDEAAILRETLERVRPIVDEWVIVDTGSTDGTQAIISEYGPVTELAFEDFVTTKNKALALAKGKYILFMDADERLLSGAEALRAVAEAGELDGLSCRIIDGPAPDQVVTQYDRFRLWYNNRLWRFEGPGVHEVVVAPAGARWRVMRAWSCGMIIGTGITRASSSGASGTSRFWPRRCNAIPGTPAPCSIWRARSRISAAGSRLSRHTSVISSPAGGMTSAGKRVTTWRCAGANWASGSKRGRRVSGRWRLIRGGLRWPGWLVGCITRRANGGRRSRI